ncbi:hypothetical protein [Collinsella tanakaei]|uniref:hypothetical protein n=1 Tax=Collinsella tanakaei TaxID=626935 RepID=UPI0025A3F537|nr:hypothetical protein [Collinsella tanakaei]MDM8302021.1 hypothetical protein [Collinsella tanakaei]
MSIGKALSAVLLPMNERETSRESQLEHISQAARAALWFCRIGAVACAVGIFLQFAAFSATLPARIPEMLDWECVGIGFSDENGLSAIRSYLVENPDRIWGDDASARYELADEAGNIHAAQAAATIVSLAFGIGLFAVGARCFKHVARTGKPFERARTREICVLGWVAVAASVVPNLVGLGVATAAYNLFYAANGFEWGPWEPGVVNWWMLVLGIFILLIARIFEYGCILQEQDDRLL